MFASERACVRTLMVADSFNFPCTVGLLWYFGENVSKLLEKKQQQQHKLLCKIISLSVGIRLLALTHNNNIFLFSSIQFFIAAINF